MSVKYNESSLRAEGLIQQRSRRSSELERPPFGRSQGQGPVCLCAGRGSTLLICSMPPAVGDKRELEMRGNEMGEGKD